MSLAATPGGSCPALVAGTVGMAATRVPAIARACARAPFGSEVLGPLIVPLGRRAPV
jgi:hypothetical protein